MMNRHRTLTALVLTLALASLVACSGEGVPGVTPGEDACAHCGMVITEANQAAGWLVDGEFVPFDSPGCLLGRHEALRKAGEPVPEELFFADYREALFHPANAITFLMTSHRPSVMGSGALAFSSREAAEAAREHEDEWLTDWTGYRTERGEPDRKVDVTLGLDGLAPRRVEVQQGELVAWTVRNTTEEGERTIAIEGYPELEPVRVPAGAEPATFRLLASRAGSGFPVVDTASDVALGSLVVAGVRTGDEEGM
jgi:hypothetical protein